MLHEGPIPRIAHGAIEYAFALFFLCAPFLFSWDSGAATAVSILMGLVILAIAASSAGPTSLVNQISTGVHVTLDYVLAVVLVAAPFGLGFRDVPTPRNLFIIVGVLHLLVTIGTRFRSADDPDDLDVDCRDPGDGARDHPAI